VRLPYHPTPTTFTQAIAVAEGGDAIGALKLFEAAARLSPIDSAFRANLGVTEMRLGLLDRAEVRTR